MPVRERCRTTMYLVRPGPEVAPLFGPLVASRSLEDLGSGLPPFYENELSESRDQLSWWVCHLTESSYYENSVGENEPGSMGAWLESSGGSCWSI